jgi:hypothetical protein
MAHQRYYSRLEHSGLSYEERVGQPEAIEAAIGRIAINFAELEKELSSVISFLIGGNIEVGKIVTAELSFRGKLTLMSSLFHRHNPESDIADRFRDLLRLCNQAEELRNQILHSSWLSAQIRHSVHRKKYTAKMKQGLREQSVEMTSGDLMDIADLISYAISMVDEFFSWQFNDYSSWTYNEVGY